MSGVLVVGAAVLAVAGMTVMYTVLGRVDLLPRGAGGSLLRVLGISRLGRGGLGHWVVVLVVVMVGVWIVHQSLRGSRIPHRPSEPSCTQV
jgi:hypothetical protein